MRFCVLHIYVYTVTRSHNRYLHFRYVTAALLLGAYEGEGGRKYNSLQLEVSQIGRLKQF